MKRLFAIGACLLFTSCAMDFLRPYNQREITGMWQEVKATHVVCTDKEMPDIVFFGTDGELMGAYVQPVHTVFIDQYASNDVFKEQFEHACGYVLGGDEVYNLPVSELGMKIRKYVAWKLIQNARASRARAAQKSVSQGMVLSQKSR